MTDLFLGRSNAINNQVYIYIYICCICIVYISYVLYITYNILYSFIIYYICNTCNYLYIYIQYIYSRTPKKKYTGECHKDSAQDLRCWIVKWTKFRVGGPNLRRCWWISWCSSSPPCFAVWMPLVHSKSMPRRRWLDWPSFWGRSFRRFPVAPRGYKLSWFIKFPPFRQGEKREKKEKKRETLYKKTLSRLE